MKSAPVPKRILMTADTVGGVWTYALELAKALEKYGTEVLLATMGAPVTRGQRREAAQLANVRIFKSAYKLEWMDDPWLDVAASGDWLLELEQRFHPDLVHLNGYAHAILPWRAPKRRTRLSRCPHLDQRSWGIFGTQTFLSESQRV